MGPAERGLLAGVLAPLFDRVGGSLQLGPLPPPTDAVAPILFRLETVVASGWVRLPRRSGAGRYAPTMSRPGARVPAAFPSRVMSRSR